MLGKISPYLPVSWRWGPRRSASPEPNDRRMLPRIPEERANAIIDGSSFPLNDWNPTGFMISPYEGCYGVGSSIRPTLVILAGGKTFRFVVTAKVVRRDKKLKQLAAVFTELDAGTTQRLKHLAIAKL